MKATQILEKIWDMVVGLENEIEDGYLTLENTTMSEEDYKERYGDILIFKKWRC